MALSNNIAMGYNKTFSGGLRTWTPISEHNSSFYFNYHISRRLHDVDKTVNPGDRTTISLTTN